MSVIGAMRYFGTLKTNQQIVDEGGGFEDNYVDVLTTRGLLTHKSGYRTENNRESLNVGTWFWRIRYQDAVTINRTSVWVIDDKEYKIFDYHRDGKYYEFTLIEVHG